MVTPAQLKDWRPERLTEIADDLVTHRKALLEQTDELAYGKVPTSYTFESAQAAQKAHDQLADALAVQVSEVTNVVKALEAAATAIRAAKEDLNGALSAAGGNHMSVDLSTGAVRITRTFETTDDAQHAATTQNWISRQIDDALAAATTADQNLAAALNAAVTTDTNSMGTLDQQRTIMEFQQLSPAKQAEYLLAHPDEYATLKEYASPETMQRVGEQIATELDEAARDPEYLGDKKNVEDLTEMLETFGDEPAVMSAMYEKLEPEGLLVTLSNASFMMHIGSNAEELGVLATELRSGLQVASQDPDFDGEGYGSDLVRYATHSTTNAERDALYDTYGTDGASNMASLDFLLREGTYGEGFVRGVAWEMDEFDRQYPNGSALFASQNAGTSPLRYLGTEPGYQPDPMNHVMTLLAEHPEMGLEFFTEDNVGKDRSDFYFGDRDWSGDGFKSVSNAMLTLGTDPGLQASSPTQQAQLVSEYFDKLADNPEFTAENAKEAAAPVAELLKHNWPSVQTGTLNSPDDCPAGVDAETGLAMVDKPDVDKLLNVALTDEDGLGHIAEGIGAYRNTQLQEYAATHDLPLETDQDHPELAEILRNSANMEGYVTSRVGAIDIAGAVNKDQQVATFATAVQQTVKTGLTFAPVPGAKAIALPAGNFARDFVNDTWGGNADATREEVTARAQAGGGYVEWGLVQALESNGILPRDESLHSRWMQDGELIETTNPHYGSVREDTKTALASIVSVEDVTAGYQNPFVKWVPPEDGTNEK